MTDRMRIIRAYLLAQIFILCITAGAVGASVAGDRTEYIRGGGIPASAQTENPVSDEQSRLTKILIKERCERMLCAMPYPVGNITALILSIEKTVENSQ